MLRLLSDENFNGEIVRGLVRAQPDLNLVRVQDVDLLGADDPRILTWAAENNCVLVTHDCATIRGRYFVTVDVNNGRSSTFRCSYPRESARIVVWTASFAT